MWFHGDIVVKDTVKSRPAQSIVLTDTVSVSSAATELSTFRKTTETTIPFFKNNEFEYDTLVWFIEDESTREMMGWLIYVAVVIFAITLLSNSANLTDGLDGLAVGVASPIGVVLAIFAYLSGNAIFSSYLNIMYLPGSGELLVYGACFVGALLGFLWYNGYPAQVFMGDTGSLAIGGIIAVFAILIRKELLLPILCGVFIAESVSVIIQVAYFKYTKYKYGEGRRVFLMSPLHHHYQKRGFFESKIVLRFWLIQLLLAAITLATLKIR
jgi:phospho-N-acetylmuramoyl-pentapeptide-transferase